MSKRKRTEHAEAADEAANHHKKRKRSKATSPERAGSYSSTRTDQKSGSKPLPSTNGSSAAPNETHGQAPPQPPPSLSRAQRKRWRRQQKKLKLLGRSEGRPSTASNGSSAAQQVKPNGSIPRVAGMSLLDKSAMKQSAKTFLMPVRKKVWHGIEATSMNDDRKASSSVQLPGKQPSSTGNGSSDTVPQQEQSSAVVATQAAATDRNDQSINPDYYIKSSKPRRSEPMQHKTGSVDKRLAEMSKDPKHQSLAVPSISFRRSSFANKPDSVPSYSEQPDAAEAFKRFSAFVQGSDSETSEDESEGSDDESDSEDHSAKQPAAKNAESRTKIFPPHADDESNDNEGEEGGDEIVDDGLATREPMVQGAGSRKQIPNESAKDESGESEDDDRHERPAVRQPAKQNTKTRQDAPAENASDESSEEESEDGSDSGDLAMRQPEAQLLDELNKDLCIKNEGIPATPASEEPSNLLEQEAEGRDEPSAEDHLPMFSSPAPPRPESTSASTWPANVGIKRQSSFLEQEAGRNRSSSGPIPEHMNKKPRQSLTPVHAKHDPFDVPEDDSEEALLTMDEISKNVFGLTRALPAMGPDAIICNSVHVPEDESFDTIEIASKHIKHNTGLPAGNINSGASDAVTESLRRSKSSSSLSELSRSPSPPAELLRNETHTKHLTEQGDKDDSIVVVQEDAEDSIVVAEGKAAPVKKRKMTGRTSKHFTPEKRLRRKAVPKEVKNQDTTTAPIVLEGTPSGSDEEPDDRSELPRAQQAIATARRPRRQRTTITYQLDQISSPSEENDDDGAEPAGDDTPRAEQAIKEIVVNRTKRPARKPAAQDSDTIEAQTPDTKAVTPSAKRSKRKSTGKHSTYFTPPSRPPKQPLDTTLLDRVDLYNTTSSGRTARVPAGTSTAPVPSINCPTFGIIQEKLWREPFWLLIAVTFLNKTTGRAAVPVFWELKKRYPTPEALADANQEDLFEMIWSLGLQRQRSKRLISMAKAWIEEPPVKGRRWRTLHYPLKGDGKEHKSGVVVEEDADDVRGALEIGQIPGCGPYAWDSWRIFCRDALRRVAEDYNGLNAVGEGFVPEWQKVLPLDKELRACLRWMWLREGWVWDPLTGDKSRATEVEMNAAVRGEMEIQDPVERKFAAQAAGVEPVQEPTLSAQGLEVNQEAGTEQQAADANEVEKVRLKTPDKAPDDLSDDSETIVVATPSKKGARRSVRLSG
ncbi:hypothetical protein LTR37_005108 [Vermiconidia calcicola]|uniref:Uncharacterized protein n=1 Tax=Vermiconidia calcicola TaxID=1690605 RepID=A0ACC3NLI0_9PEZI|nr:hypothetical protein LTR37_005108 [Vermiconidia calcicola]